MEFFSEDDDLVDIRKDYVFKAVFARDTPESMGALSKLVSALIETDVSIVSILANEPPIDNISDRQIRFDINCRAENDELINVEMCFNPDAFEPLRMEYYTTKLFSGQELRGIERDYKDLKKAYQIAIISKLKFYYDEEFLHSFAYYDKKRNVSLGGKTQIITLELSKLQNVVNKPAAEMSITEQWAYYLAYLTDKSKRSIINEIVEMEEGIAMASSVLRKVSKDEEERARIMRDEKIELDYQSYLASARKSGHAEGHVEGHAEGKKEERDYVLELIAQGLTTEEIKHRLES